MKEILLEEGIDKILDGMNGLASITSLTLGPGGKNVMLHNVMREPHITKDGVSVAKEVMYEDPFMNAGAMLLRNVSKKTCDDVGDATTTSCLISYIGTEIGLSKTRENAGIRPIRLKRELDAVCKKLVSHIQDLAVPCDDEGMMEKVATVSVNGDKELARLVCKAMRQATKDGAVSIETSPNSESFVDTVTGMRFERGWESEFFKNNENMNTCTFESPNVMIWRGTVDNVKEFMKALEPSLNIGRPLLVMADNYSYDIVNMLAMNKVNMGFNICAVKLPSFGEQREDMVHDLEILLSCRAINTVKDPVDSFDPEIHLGSCDKVTVDRHFTTISGGDGSVEDINARIRQIRDEIDNTTDNSKAAKLKERLVKLAGGVSIIYIGSDSETETNEIKDRVEDAVCAVRSAMQEGVVPGGGVTYIYLSVLLDKMDNASKEAKDVLHNMLTAPFFKMMSNIGYDKDSETAKETYDKLRLQFAEGKPDAITVFDMEHEGFVNDCYKEGLVDPAKVSRVALENAVSMAGMIITMGGGICEMVEK